MSATQIFSPADRETTLARAIELLEDDPRVEAAMVTGSLGAGRGDRWSDFDLTAIVAEGQQAVEVARDWDALAYREWSVVHHYATEFGSTLVRGFLLRNGLLADLAFTPVADLEVWAPVRIAFDRTGSATRAAGEWQPWTPTPDWRGEAGFAMHDILHACVAANRNKPWQSLYFLQRVRNRTLTLACERRGADAQDFARVDEIPSGETAALRRTLVTDLAPATLLQAIERAADAFLRELHSGDPELAVRMGEPLRAVIRASRRGA